LATTDEMRTIGEEIREDYEGFITELGVDLLDSRFSDDPRVLRMLAVNVYGLMHVGYEFLALFRWYVSGFFPLIGGRGSRYAAPVSASDFPGDEFPHVARSSEHQVVQSIRRSSGFRQPTELRQSADFPQDDKTPAVVELPQADETPITEEFTQADETPITEEFTQTDKTPTAEYFPHTKAPDPSEEPQPQGRSPRFVGPVDTENAERAADAVKPSGPSGSERRRGHFESETGRDDASEGAVNLRGDGGADSRHDGPAAESVPESGAADAARFRQGEGSPLSDMSGHKDLKELARFLESQEEEERAHVSSRRGPLSHHASELDALLEELTERIEQEYLRFYGD